MKHLLASAAVVVKVITYYYMYSHQPSAGILTMFPCRRDMISCPRDRLNLFPQFSTWMLQTWWKKIGRTLAHPLQQRTANQTMPAINDEETKLTLHVPSADPSIADALGKGLEGGGGLGAEVNQKL